MTRYLTVAAAAAAALVFTPAAGMAQSAHGYYSATPATAPAKATLVTRSTLWKCDGGVCLAPKATSRDEIMCELVVREVGALTAFSANGQNFDADALAKCNTRAK